MKNIKFLIAGMSIAALLVFVSLSGKEVDTSVSAIGTTENPRLGHVIDQYAAIIEEAIAAQKVPGAAVTIVRDTAVIFSKGFGVKKYGGQDSIDAHTVFKLGSVSKGFAALLAGIHVQDGYIGWQDPVVKYVPGFKLKSDQQTQNLLVSNVLSHTTGLPMHAYTNLIEEGMEHSALINQLRDVDVIGSAGQVYAYQNVAYSLIEDVLGNATGQKFEALLSNKIFKPLHMSDASASYEDFVRNSNIAQPHMPYGKRWKSIRVSKTYYNSLAAGGVNASISDMGQWLLALLGRYPEVVSQATLEQLYQPQVITPIRNKYNRNWKKLNNLHYGLGWRIFEYGDLKVVYHGGYVNGYRSEIAIIPEQKIGICVLTNALNSFAGTSIPRFLELYEEQAEYIQEWDDFYNLIAMKPIGSQLYAGRDIDN